MKEVGLIIMKKILFLALTVCGLFLLPQNAYSQKIVKVEIVQLGANHIFPRDPYQRKHNAKNWSLVKREKDFH